MAGFDKRIIVNWIKKPKKTAKIQLFTPKFALIYTPKADPKGLAPKVTVIITDDIFAILSLGVTICLSDTVDIVHIIGPNPKKKKEMKTNSLTGYITVKSINIDAIKAEMGPNVSWNPKFIFLEINLYRNDPINIPKPIKLNETPTSKELKERLLIT